VERKFLVGTDSLDDRISRYPILAFIFNDGLILGQKFSVSRIVPSKSKKNKTVSGSWRINIENSGFPYAGFPKPFAKKPLKEFENNLFSFAKFEFDRRWNMEKGKKGWAFRTYTGVGIPYNKNIHLPFFKQFTAGGPNSMRAWGVRNLNSYSTRTNTPEVSDFYGDILVEANAEYRFTLFRSLMGFPIKSAFFLDMGNIWNLKPYDPLLVPTNMSTVDKFLIRLDFGLKLKTPLDISGKGGLFDSESLNFKRDGLRPFKMQVGINYPF
jgi:outer membrane translocation and assembly module TamA